MLHEECDGWVTALVTSKPQAGRSKGGTCQWHDSLRQQEVQRKAETDRAVPVTLILQTDFSLNYNANFDQIWLKYQRIHTVLNADLMSSVCSWVSIKLCRTSLAILAAPCPAGWDESVTWCLQSFQSRLVIRRTLIGRTQLPYMAPRVYRHASYARVLV